MKSLLVVGAAGDVGEGIVHEAAVGGWTVAAAGRTASGLDRIAADHGPNVVSLPGSIARMEDAKALIDAATARIGPLDGVVVSVNAGYPPCRILDWEPDALLAALHASVLCHLVAAKAIIPRLRPGAVYIGIGGGMADIVQRQRAHVSMGQAALRMMYRALAKETPMGSVQVRELLIVSRVNARSTHAFADPAWLTAAEIGAHVCAIIADPARFPGPVLSLTSRDQVGVPAHA